jgi:hypothetical protein
MTPIYTWIVSLLLTSIAPLVYICLDQYKTIKKQKKLLELKDAVIKSKERFINTLL